MVRCSNPGLLDLSYYSIHLFLSATNDSLTKVGSQPFQLSGVLGAPAGVFRHPMLGVIVCQQCRLYYKDGKWEQDEEGYDVFCRLVKLNAAASAAYGIAGPGYQLACCVFHD